MIVSGDAIIHRQCRTAWNKVERTDKVAFDVHHCGLSQDLQKSPDLIPVICRNTKDFRHL
jgi:hypothetical protein